MHPARTSAALVALLLSGPVLRAVTQAPAEPGVLPPQWTAEKNDCPNVPPFLVHEYTDTFIILRQSGCTNFEKPFLYLLLGSKQALLVDTGASGGDVSGTLGDLLARHAQRRGQTPLPLLAVHSHGHSDHTAGDSVLKAKGIRVVEAKPTALAEFFKLQGWPRETAQFDLGDRVIHVVPIPGHQEASIAIYDERTRILLTGDTLYPGRLYIRDGKAFAESIDRLVEFTANHPVAHVLGAHIENTRTPFADYPEGTSFQPEEHALELGRAHLLELQDALRQMGGVLQRRSLRDFTVWPIAR